MWGAKKTRELNELKKLIKKSWSKIGNRIQHTNDRLREHNILKLEDELKLGEIKLIWRWLKNRLPNGLKYIITERHSTVNLRNRSFNRDNNWKQDSIAYRLATRANKEIKEIEVARSKKGLSKKYKNKIILTEYNRECRNRNCIICGHN